MRVNMLISQGNQSIGQLMENQCDASDEPYGMRLGVDGRDAFSSTSPRPLRQPVRGSGAFKNHARPPSLAPTFSHSGKIGKFEPGLAGPGGGRDGIGAPGFGSRGSCHG